MRCDDLAGTWADLTAWLDGRGVLVLPQLVGDLPVVRLDSDLSGRAAVWPSTATAIDRLKGVVDRFDTRAVYAHRVGTDAVDLAGNGEPSMVTVRVLAGGVIHELTLVAGWYCDLLDRTVGMEFIHRP